MGLLSPWFLAGALAVGLPIWLHLLRQHRRTTQSFSSVMFFERRLQSSVQSRRLRYLLLLALRIALLLLLAVAFASPFINRKTIAPSAKTLTIIAVDRSFSMRYGDRMKQAKLRAQEELRNVRGRGLVEVLAVDSRVEALTTPTLDRRELNAAIDAIQPDDLAGSFGQFVRALRAQEQTSGMWLDVKFVSDMQRTGMPRTFADLQAGPHTALRLISVAQAKEPNWAIETVNAPAHVYGEKAHVTATVAGWQTGPARKTIALLMDGKTIATKEVNVPANGRAPVEFSGFDVPYGFHRAEVAMEQHDQLSEDDSFPFPLQRSDPRKILFVTTGGRPRDALYYRAAMESATDTGLTVQLTPLDQVSDRDLAQGAFVVLNDPGMLSTGNDRRLLQYVRKGGSLLIAIGARSADGERVPVTEDRFRIDRQAQGVTFVDGQTAALRDLGQFTNVQFFETARLEPQPDARILMKLADGSPLLVEERIGAGRVLTFASGFDNVTNDFPLHSSFLPFVVQVGRYLAGNLEEPATLVAGSPIELRHPGDNPAAAVNITGPDGRNELPLQEAAKAVSFEVDRDGFYEVQRAHGPRALVAVHTDRRESDLTPIPEQTLTLWRNMGKQSPVPNSGAREQTVQPWSLWRYFLILAFAAALAESILANRYLHRRKQAVV